MKKFLRSIKIVIKKLLRIYFVVGIVIFIAFVMPELVQNASDIAQILYLTPLAFLVSLLISFFMVSFTIGPIMWYYVLFQIGTEVVDTIEESEQKSVDNNVYFRDIPEGYSPVIASLILNKWLEEKTDLTAMILYLIKKGYLVKNGDNISYTGKDLSELSESEKYIAECYSDNNNSFNFIKWREIVVKEAIEKGYVKDAGVFSIQNIKKSGKNAAIIIFACMIIINILHIEILDIILSTLVSFLIPFGIVLFLIYAFRRSQVNIKLTEKGVIEQEKLVKLRKFLNDFSSLEESNEDAMILWQDYLIYAISLGVNTDIVEKSKLYKKLDENNYIINQQMANEISLKFTNQINNMNQNL